LAVPAPFVGEAFGRTYYDHIHEFSAALRAETPVYRAVMPDGLPVWMITRYAEELTALYGQHMLLTDPPNHTSLRTRLTRAFTPRRVEALPVTEPVDLIEKYARPLPATAIAELLGVPTEDRPQFRGHEPRPT
jgi:cytochrome P450